jgi:hypothetical protein
MKQKHKKGTLRRVSGSITVGSDTNGDGYPDVPLSYTIRVSLFILRSKRSVQLYNLIMLRNVIIIDILSETS